MKKMKWLTGSKTAKRGLTALLMWPVLVLAQSEFSGTLKDAGTGKTIPGALIRIKNSYQATYSDPSGYFIFPGLKGDSAHFSISHLSYENYAAAVALPAEKLIIELLTKTYLSDEVTITATRADEKSGMAYSIIERAELEQQNMGQDLPYLLQATPSLVVTSDAGNGIGYSGLRIRGSDATRINVTLNGVPVNDAESHQVYWVDLPDLASSIENIQVQRGLGTSSNGPGSFGGSVNLLSNQVKLQSFSEISSSAGSFNTFKNTLRFGTGMINDHFSMEGRLSKISSDGFIDRATSDLKSLFFSGGYYGKNSVLRAILLSGKEKTYQAWYGVPMDSLKTNRSYNPAGEYYDEQGRIRYYDNQTDNYQQDYYQLHYSTLLNEYWTLNLATHYTRGRGYYEEYASGDSFEKYHLQNPIVGNDTLLTSDFIRRRWLDNHFYGLTGSLNCRKNLLDVKIGWGATRYEGDHFGEVHWSKDAPVGPEPQRYYEDDAQKYDLSLFTKVSYLISPKVNLFVDLQGRQIDYSFTGYNRDFQLADLNAKLNFFNPKAGFHWTLKEGQLVYASIGMGHKEPVRDDYINAGPGSRPKSEKLSDLEAGYRFSAKKFSATANVFLMTYKDQLILTGKINDVGEYTRENVPSSYRRGIELEAGYLLSTKLTLSGNLSLSENKIKVYKEYIDNYDEGVQVVNEYSKSDIAFSPNVTAYMSLNWQLNGKFNLELNGKHVGKQFLDNTSNDARALEAYLISNFRAEYRLNIKGIRDLRFQFAMYNLLDNEYAANGYTYSYIYDNTFSTFNYHYPQAGRNFLAGIRLSF